MHNVFLRIVGTYLVPFITVPSAPLNFSLAPISGSPDMLLAMWTAPARRNNSITAYTVYCNTSATQAYIEPLVVNGTTLTTIIDHDLGPDSQYYCYVTANTSSGEGMASRVLSARTSELSEPICSVAHYSFVKSTCIEIMYIAILLFISFSNTVPSAPLNVSLVPVSGSPNKLLIIWTPPVSRNGIITAYSVYCNPSESQENPVHLIGRNASTIKVVVNETTSAIVLDKYLNPDTQYECYVTATTSAGEGAPSERVTTRTSESGEQCYA